MWCPPLPAHLLSSPHPGSRRWPQTNAAPGLRCSWGLWPVRPTRHRPGLAGDHCSSPSRSCSRLNFFHVRGRRCSGSFPPWHPPSVPPRPRELSGTVPLPGSPRASPTWPGTLRAGRLQPFPSRALRCRLLAAASVWPRRTRRGEGGSRRGSAAPGRRPRGGRSGRRRPKLAAQAGRCDSASPPPAAARGGVGEARPPGGRVLQGRGGCRRRGIPARGSPDPAGSPPHSLWRSGLWGARSRTGPRGAGRTSVPGPRRTASWRGGCGTFPTDVGDTNFQVLLPNWGNCANSPNTHRVFPA